MRKDTPSTLSLLTGACLLLLLSSCFKDKVTKTYTIVRPVYTLKTTLLGNINGNPGQPIGSIGRLYIKDNFIYLNEPEKGLHIIDNSDPTHPQQTAFLNIPGNEEIAINGNTLYADMYRELLAIDISNPRQIRITGMTDNVFLDRYNGVSGYTTFNNGAIIDSNLLLTGYITKDTTMDTDAPTSVYGGIYPIFFYALAAAASSSNAGNGAGSGIAGSMAKMVLLNNHLYTIPEPHSIAILDVSNAPSPGPASTVYAGYDLETIYPFHDKLFLGSKEGVFIYDVSNPLSPVQQGTFTHGRACDPVIADDNYAYVTLHAGTTCGGNSNELDVVNVQNLAQPTLVASYPMTKPEGLSKDNNLLFVCDGTDGVKLYDASNPAGLQLLTQIPTAQTEATDVIAANQRLFIIAGSSLYQYDYSNPQNIRLLSTLSVK
ncbi:MAG TPA: hypothetical protein VNS58_06475 [Puia sp.]|nr:hypothetical protein [Puia sp.]